MNSKFENIDSPKLLKNLDYNELPEYCNWLRQFLIDSITETGGHFAANLGVVELSVALHYVFNSPTDKMIWDVGHQSYPHKVLTGRKKEMSQIRQFGGISGFPKLSESEHDAFGTAHSSTSISAALGFAIAAKFQNIKRQHLAIIGDGALSAGQAFEGLNNAGIADTNLTVIINDNHIGIDPSQGALGEYLEHLDLKKENLFTDFGFQYFGPIDGHNVIDLIEIFKTTASINSPKIIHIKTIKGKGHLEAEKEQTLWHSVQKFDKLASKNETDKSNQVKFQDVFGKTLLELATKDEKIVAVTPAMISGSSLHFFQEQFPERVFDVGIAEQHAITFSAAMASSGMTVFCSLYSTFLQRGLDQIIHDVALQNLPVIFAIDRAGIVGEDGPTHHGVFDIQLLQSIPNCSIYSPSNQTELRNLMYSFSKHRNGPVFIRYPRGKDKNPMMNLPFQLHDLQPKCLKVGNDIAVLSYGVILNVLETILNKTAFALYDLVSLKPLNQVFLEQIFKQFKKILIVEESMKIGGIASSILLIANELNYKGTIKILAIEDHFVPHGSMSQLFDLERLNENSIFETLNQFK